jgi:hypothetical protein
MSQTYFGGGILFGIWKDKIMSVYHPRWEASITSLNSNPTGWTEWNNKEEVRKYIQTRKEVK